MTDETPSSPRGPRGRFVSQKAHTGPVTAAPDAGVHPAARLLFGWTGHRRAGALIFWGLAVLSVAMLGADLLVHRKDYFEFAAGAGFYGLFGFSVFTLIVMAGWPLGKLLRRRADFYHPPEDVPEHTDPAIAANPSLQARPGDHA